MAELEELDYFKGMSKEDIADYQEAEKRVVEEAIEHHARNAAIIRSIKRDVPKKLFKYIASAIHESDNWSNVRIVNKPTGKPQKESNHIIWVDQYCEYEDCYSGHCYIELPDGSYLAWDYWC